MSQLFSPSAPSVGLEARGLGPSGQECGGLGRAKWSLEGGTLGRGGCWRRGRAAVAGG